MAWLLLALAASLSALCNAQSSFHPARPPAIPLAVKSPYMNTWLQAGADGGDGGYLAGEWPTFWSGGITAWTGLIRVDGTTFIWMGGLSTIFPTVNQTSFEYTSTRSIFTMNVNGLVGLNVTFLSPVTPHDFLRSSLPFSYLEVTVSSLDGAAHSVQLYTDISAEWISGDRNALAYWDYGVIPYSASPQPVASSTTSTTAYSTSVVPTTTTASHTTYATQQSYSGWTTQVIHSNTHSFARPPAELSLRPPGSSSSQNSSASATGASTSTSASSSNGSSSTGSSSTSSSGNSSSSGSSSASSTRPSSTPTQTNGIAYHRVYREEQSLFSEINDQADWGYWYYVTANTNTLTHESSPDPRRQFNRTGNLTNTADPNFRPVDIDYPVFGFALDLGSVDASHSPSSLFGIGLAQEIAVQFEGVTTEAVPSLWTSYFASQLDAMSFYYNDYGTQANLSNSFDNMVAADSIAAGGQSYLTATSLAVRQAFAGTQLCGTPNTTYNFLKEISSDGNVNTVDVIFPFHPLLIYTNPTLLKLLLDPLFINQEAGHWPFQFSIHDIGSHYPNATGHNNGNAEQQPLEECGNMLIMTLAYAQRTNDNAYLAQHYDILRQWTGYLIDDSLYPQNQISTDDFAGALVNQTNLAVKGMIGIEAMAQIANRTGHIADGINFTQIAHNYISQWLNLGFNYDANPPHATLNYGSNNSWGLLYNIYSDKELGLGLVPQSVFDIQSAFYPTQERLFGVPLDTRHNYTKNDWEIWCAAVASPSTAALFYNDIANWINVTPTSRPLTDLYDTVTGNFPGIFFVARPVVGGYFAPLALNTAPTTGIYLPSSNTAAA